MFRMNGQKIAPAFSALPPSLAGVLRGRMDARERRMFRMNGMPRVRSLTTPLDPVTYEPSDPTNKV